MGSPPANLGFLRERSGHDSKMTIPGTECGNPSDELWLGFFRHLAACSATIDERLSVNFEVLLGQKRDTDTAAQRLAAWCRSFASGDWSLFGPRLARDRLTFDHVLPRFATVRYSPTTAPPVWIGDARSIEAALRSGDTGITFPDAEPYAFQHLLWPLVQRADTLLEAAVDPHAPANLTNPHATVWFRCCSKSCPVFAHRPSTNASFTLGNRARCHASRWKAEMGRAHRATTNSS